MTILFHPCEVCVNDGKSSCMDYPCRGCPHEQWQVYEKQFPDKEI